MPWQAAPSLIIIFGAFNVAAGLIWTVDRAYYGKVCCVFLCIEWKFCLLVLIAILYTVITCQGISRSMFTWIAFD